MFSTKIMTPRIHNSLIWKSRRDIFRNKMARFFLLVNWKNIRKDPVGLNVFQSRVPLPCDFLYAFAVLSIILVTVSSLFNSSMLIFKIFPSSHLITSSVVRLPWQWLSELVAFVHGEWLIMSYRVRTGTAWSGKLQIGVYSLTLSAPLYCWSVWVVPSWFIGQQRMIRTTSWVTWQGMDLFIRLRPKIPRSICGIWNCTAERQMCLRMSSGAGLSDCGTGNHSHSH